MKSLFLKSNSEESDKNMTSDSHAHKSKLSGQSSTIDACLETLIEVSLQSESGCVICDVAMEGCENWH